MQNIEQKEIVKRVIRYRLTEEEADFEYILNNIMRYNKILFLKHFVPVENQNYLNYRITKQVIEQYDLTKKNEVKVTTFAYTVAESRIIDYKRKTRKKESRIQNTVSFEYVQNLIYTEELLEEDYELEDEYIQMQKVFKKIKKFIEHSKFPKVKVRASKNGKYKNYQEVYLKIIERQLFTMLKNKEKIKDKEYEHRNHLKQKYIKEYAEELNVSPQYLQRQIKLIEDYFKLNKTKFKETITTEFLENLIIKRKYNTKKRKKSLEL